MCVLSAHPCARPPNQTQDGPRQSIETVFAIYCQLVPRDPLLTLRSFSEMFNWADLGIDPKCARGGFGEGWAEGSLPTRLLSSIVADA